MSGFQVRVVSVSVLCAALCVGAGAPAHATAIAGSTGGEFVHPLGPPAMRVNGVGTDLFLWGVATGWRAPSFLRFSGVPVATQIDVPFSFGVLSYFNSTTMFGTEATSVDLAVSLALEGPEQVTRSFSYPLHLINSLNTSDPIQSADSVLFPAAYPSAAFSLGGIDYTLVFDGFGNVSGGGFVPLQDNQFFVLEGQAASAELVGRITVAPARPVPEPGTLLSLATGLAGFSLAARRRR